MKKLRLILLCLGFLPRLVLAEEAPSGLSQAQKEEVARLQAEKTVLEARTAALKAQNDLRAQEIAKVTPAVGKDVTALSGKVEGVKELDMALYIAAVHSLQRIQPTLCSDLGAHPKLFVTATDVTEAILRTKTLDETEVEYRRKVDRATFEVNELLTALKGLASGPVSAAAGKELSAKAASISGVAAALDAGAGLTKGVIGLASMFKSEITFNSLANVLSNVELESALHCDGKLKVQFVDQNYRSLGDAVKTQAERLKDVTNTTVKLLSLADDLRVVRANVERQSKQKNSAGRAMQPVLAKIDKTLTAADALVVSGSGFVDAFYVVDPTTGIAPLAVAGKYRKLAELVLVDGYEQLQFTVQRSGGYTMTKRRAIFNDKVAFAGGAAFRVAVTGKDGLRTHDRLYYAQTGWVPLDLEAAASIPLHNVAREL